MTSRPFADPDYSYTPEEIVNNRLAFLESELSILTGSLGDMEHKIKRLERRLALREA